MEETEEKEVPKEEETEEAEALTEEEATLAEEEVTEAAEEEKAEEKEKEEITEEEAVEERPRIREEIPEEEIVEERIYTIPLREAWRSPRKNRTPRAIRLIRNFIQRHMKIGLKVGLEEEEEGRLIISNEVNEWVWRRGIEKPPRKVRVRAVKDRDGNVTVYLAEGD